MKLELGDRLLLDNIEGIVAFIGPAHAWLIPSELTSDGDYFRKSYLVRGVAFAKIDLKTLKMADGTQAKGVSKLAGAV